MMARKGRFVLVSAIASTVFLFSLFHNLLYDAISNEDVRRGPVVIRDGYGHPSDIVSNVIQEERSGRRSRQVSPVADSFSTVSVLLPAWEVLIIVSEVPPMSMGNDYVCVFQNNDTSPAMRARALRFFNRTTFKCVLPNRVRRRSPFLQPILTRLPDIPSARASPPQPPLMRWNFLVYDSLSTDNDVILFVKGLNNRQGGGRAPTEFRCVFGEDAINGVKTAVTTAVQEVFRCQRPKLTAVSPSKVERIKVSLEIIDEKRLVPSVAYHTPGRKIAATRGEKQEKSLLCACTMVYNVAKFLKEWVMYHSKIGVEKFILYDNDSDDELQKVVEGLAREGYDVTTLFWLWPKTQEAGFSHCATYAKDTCSWMLYIDIDEFVYSPLWSNLSEPSSQMLQSLLPESPAPKDKIGQVMIGCHEFGPSDQKSHPKRGVTQGYNCRKKMENRHKSIVSLDAIDDSLLNVIHHFRLKEGYGTKKLRDEEAVVNHYKFQAWPEFKNKFRRRVSAYVVDWTKAANPMSKDRTPGLGFSAVEPDGWSEKFCEVYDDGLKELTRKWFGLESDSEIQMAWQR